MDFKAFIEKPLVVWPYKTVASLVAAAVVMATLWPAFVKDQTIPEWLADHGLPLTLQWVIGVIASLVVIVTLIGAIAARKNPNRGRLPDGAATWKLIRVTVPIPDARESKQSRLWADGLGKWLSFSTHNLWANQPITREDFTPWRNEFHKWCKDVTVWMKTAGCPDGDVRKFDELGEINLQPGQYHSDPNLNYELTMLVVHRDSLKALINRYEQTPAPKTIRPTIAIEVGPGMVRLPLWQAPSVDIRLSNSGDPFTLVAHAELVETFPGLVGAGHDRWVYEPREIFGGNGASNFHIATYQHGVGDWSVTLWSERMVKVREWQASPGMYCDVRWNFDVNIDGMLSPIAVVVTRVTWNDDSRELSVTKLSESILPGPFIGPSH